jgi:hypothetical protein
MNNGLGGFFTNSSGHPGPYNHSILGPTKKIFLPVIIYKKSLTKETSKFGSAVNPTIAGYSAVKNKLKQYFEKKT